MMCGGTAGAQPADEETQQVINEAKADVEQKLQKQLTTFNAVQVARQMVAGVNYFVKVDIGDGNFIHVRVYKNLPCYGSKIELSGIKTGVSANDDVGYFEGFHL